MHGFLQDMRHATRLFGRAPAMSTAVVASLALGIAANTAVFSFVNAIQFKPLPVEDETTLVDLSETSETELCAGCAVGTSYPTYRDWKQGAASFLAMGAYREERFVISSMAGSEEASRPAPERIGGALVSAELFQMLGVQPVLGRGFLASDDTAAAAPVVLLSDVLWQSRFGADARVLGVTLKVNGVVHTVVGVMPPQFRFPEFAKLWVPLAPAAEKWALTDRSLSVVARLRRGIDLRTARAEMRSLGRRRQPRLPPRTRGGAPPPSRSGTT